MARTSKDICVVSTAGPGGAIERRDSFRMRRAALLLAFTASVLACSLAGCSQPETHAQPQAAAPLSVSYIGAWGMKGDGPGQLDEPTCIATDVLGNIFLADAGSHFIHKFNWEGRPLLSFEEPVLKHPQRITVDSGGAIYVTDSGRGSAFVFLPNGDRYRELRLRTRPNTENVLSVAVGDDGLIHLLDASTSRISTFTPRFRLVRSWQPAASAPNAKIRTGAVAVGPDGYLYVTDLDGNRILRFTNEGHFVSTVDARADGTDRKLSDEIAVTRGYIFAMDIDGRMLHVWSADGQPKLDVDLAPELGQANRAVPALAVSPRKELLVLDAPESRVLRYRLNL